MKIICVDKPTLTKGEVEMRFRCVSAGGGCEEFWYGETPVTEAQWADVMGEGPSSRKPKLGVSFEDAQRFCEKAGGLRLPTELEQCWAMGREPAELREYAVFDRKECPEVATLLPNEWGLYDMRGLCWEWAETGQEKKTLRGGAWRGNRGVARAVCRDLNRPAFRSGSFGFRVVVDHPAQ